MQGLADQECGLGHRIGGAVREHQFRLDEPARRIADEIEQRPQFAGGDLREVSAAARPRLAAGFGAFRHQDLVQRAAAASS